MQYQKVTFVKINAMFLLLQYKLLSEMYLKPSRTSRIEHFCENS